MSIHSSTETETGIVKEIKHARSLAVTDCSGYLVLAHRVGIAKRGRAGLNEPKMLGRGRKEYRLFRLPGHALPITIVADDDTDVTDLNRVMWAVVSLCDPAQDIEIIRRCWSTRLDPIAYPENQRRLNNRMVIDACIPFERRQTFPKVATTSPELKAAITAKFPRLFPVKVCP